MAKEAIGGLANIDGGYLAYMEDILDLHEQPYVAKQPVACFDERNCQLLGFIAFLPMKRRSVRKENYSYHHDGILFSVDRI